MATTSINNDTTKRYDVGSDDTSNNYQTLANTYNNNANQTTDYYNALNDESYKTMLNSEIQASQAKQQALKYTQNALQANGYSGQGVSESTMAGINASYNNALSNAYSTYQGAVNTNNVAKQQALSDLDQNYYNALTSQQQYNQNRNDTLSQSNYENYMSGAEMITNGEQLEDWNTKVQNDSTLTESQKDTASKYYDSMKETLEENEEAEETASNTIGSVTTANALMKDYNQYSKDEVITDTNNDTYKVASYGSSESSSTNPYLNVIQAQNGSYSITDKMIRQVFGSNALSKLSKNDGDITYIGKIADETWANNLGLEKGKNYYAMAINGYSWVILQK